MRRGGDGGLRKKNRKTFMGSVQRLWGRNTGSHTTTARLYFTGNQLLPSHTDFQKSLSLQRTAGGSPSILRIVYLNQFQNLWIAKVSQFDLICFKSLQPSPAKTKGMKKRCLHLKPSPNSWALITAQNLGYSKRSVSSQFAPQETGSPAHHSEVSLL